MGNMLKRYKLILPLTFCELVFSHEMRQNFNLDSLGNCIKEGAIHMITGYDHILFLIGVIFFLTNYLDIFKNLITILWRYKEIRC